MLYPVSVRSITHTCATLGRYCNRPTKKRNNTFQAWWGGLPFRAFCALSGPGGSARNVDQAECRGHVAQPSTCVAASFIFRARPGIKMSKQLVCAILDLGSSPPTKICLPEHQHIFHTAALLVRSRRCLSLVFEGKNDIHSPPSPPQKKKNNKQTNERTKQTTNAHTQC